MGKLLFLKQERVQHDVVQAEHLAFERLCVVKGDGDFRFGGDEHDVMEVASGDTVVLGVAAFFTLIDMDP